MLTQPRKGTCAKLSFPSFLSCVSHTGRKSPPVLCINCNLSELRFNAKPPPPLPNSGRAQGASPFFSPSVTHHLTASATHRETLKFFPNVIPSISPWFFFPSSFNQKRPPPHSTPPPSPSPYSLCFSGVSNSHRDIVLFFSPQRCGVGSGTFRETAAFQSQKIQFFPLRLSSVRQAGTASGDWKDSFCGLCGKRESKFFFLNVISVSQNRCARIDVIWAWFQGLEIIVYLDLDAASYNGTPEASKPRVVSPSSDARIGLFKTCLQSCLNPTGCFEQGKSHIFGSRQTSSAARVSKQNKSLSSGIAVDVWWYKQLQAMCGILQKLKTNEKKLQLFVVTYRSQTMKKLTMEFTINSSYCIAMVSFIQPCFFVVIVVVFVHIFVYAVKKTATFFLGLFQQQINRDYKDFWD